jgi:hypothetical protein
MSDKPCGCCKKNPNGYWVQWCDCGNSGDLSSAESWCTEKNVSIPLLERIALLEAVAEAALQMPRWKEDKLDNALRAAGYLKEEGE